MTPRENYTIYLSIAFDLEPWNPLIHNMVSERYGDSDFDSVSDEEDDFDGDEEEDLEASASATSSSSASQVSVVFGSFGDSVSTPPPSPWITPVIDGFTNKIGDVPCFLVGSRCSNQKFAFDASEENQKLQDRDYELIVSAKSTNSTNRDSEFIVSEAAIKNSKHLIIDIVVSCSGPVYDASVFVGKQDQALITIKNNFQCFDLHDEHIVDFNPDGRIGSFFLFFVLAVLRQIQFRLWWKPWDRGRHNLIPVKLFLHNLFPNYISTLILTFPKSRSRQETKFLISFSSRIGELIVQLPLKTISEFQSKSKQLKSFLLEKPFLVACFSNRVYRNVCGIAKLCLKTRLAAKSNFRWNCFLCVFFAFA